MICSTLSLSVAMFKNRFTSTLCHPSLTHHTTHSQDETDSDDEPIPDLESWASPTHPYSYCSHQNIHLHSNLCTWSEFVMRDLYVMWCFCVSCDVFLHHVTFPLFLNSSRVLSSVVLWFSEKIYLLWISYSVFPIYFQSIFNTHDSCVIHEK